MGYLRKVYAIVWKDVRAELRTKDILSSMLVFAALAVVIFQFAFDLRADNARLVLPGVVWIAILYLSLFTTAGTFFLLQFASMRLPASKTLAYGYLTPSFIILFEGLLGHGWATASVLAGAAVTVLGLAVMAFARD